jgi:hypothetical protein
MRLQKFLIFCLEVENKTLNYMEDFLTFDNMLFQA